VFEEATISGWIIYEVEYVAIDSGTQQAIWFRRIMKDVGEEQRRTYNIFLVVVNQL
jgi:hypothetical protein